MNSKIGFEMNLIVVQAIRGRCASFTVLTATVSEIFGGQTTPSILVVQGVYRYPSVCLRQIHSVALPGRSAPNLVEAVLAREPLQTL